MKRFVRETLTPLLALTCAASVFFAAALESPDMVPAIGVPALQPR